MPITLDGTNGITTPSYGGADAAEYIVPVTAFKNRIINGAAIIFQRGTSTAVDSTYFVDRWYIAKVGSGTYTADASATVPAGFFRSLLATVNTPDSSIAANDEFSIRQHIEGYNLVDFNWGTANAQTATLSFWVRSSVAGTYAVAVRSQNSDVTYVTTYTISATNTYEYKSVTIPGPTSGTFGQTNDVGCTVIFGLGGGTDFQGTANTWNSGNKFFTSSSTQWISNSGATWNVTGVQFEKGSTATSFDTRSYGTELALCQRYYQKSYDTNSAVPVVNTVVGSTGGYKDRTSDTSFLSTRFKVEMRATPTVTTYDYQGNSGKMAGGSNSSLTATVYQQGTSGFNTASGTGNPGIDSYVNFAASAEL